MEFFLFVILSLCESLIPEYNSLSKASALKVDTALRKLAALSLQGERHKTPRNVPKLLRELSSGIIKNKPPTLL